MIDITAGQMWCATLGLNQFELPADRYAILVPLWSRGRSPTLGREHRPGVLTGVAFVVWTACQLCQLCHAPDGVALPQSLP